MVCARPWCSQRHTVDHMYACICMRAYVCMHMYACICFVYTHVDACMYRLVQIAERSRSGNGSREGHDSHERCMATSRVDKEMFAICTLPNLSSWSRCGVSATWVPHWLQQVLGQGFFSSHAYSSHVPGATCKHAQDFARLVGVPSGNAAGL